MQNRKFENLNATRSRTKLDENNRSKNVSNNERNRKREKKNRKYAGKDKKK